MNIYSQQKEAGTFGTQPGKLKCDNGAMIRNQIIGKHENNVKQYTILPPYTDHFFKPNACCI